MYDFLETRKVRYKIKHYYDINDFNSDDVYDIIKETTKEDELFNHANVLSDLKNDKKSKNDKDKENFEVSI